MIAATAEGEPLATTTVEVREAQTIPVLVVPAGQTGGDN